MADLEVNGEISIAHWREMVGRANERVKGRGGGTPTTVAGVVAVVVFVSVPFLLSEWFGYDFSSLMLGAACGAAVWLLYQRAAFVLISSYWLRRDGVLLGRSRVTVGEAGLVSEGRYGRSQYDWAIFEDVRSYAKIIVVWTDPGSGILVPRDAFATPELERAFLQQIKARIEAARAEHPSPHIG